METKIYKVDEEKQIVFGFASIIEVDGEAVVDKENDVIEEDELEKAAYNFTIHARVAGERHLRKGVGDLIESCVFTKEKQKALGIDLGCVGWWIGFHITDDDVWKAVQKGDYSMFSIGGSGDRTEMKGDE